jgi:hypothetical protein
MGRGGGWGRGLGFGRSLAWRRGRGRGFGGYWGYRAPIYGPEVMAPPAYIPPASPETQVTMLKQEKQFLESEMEGIKGALADISKRIEELEKTE